MVNIFIMVIAFMRIVHRSARDVKPFSIEKKVVFPQKTCYNARYE